MDNLELGNQLLEKDGAVEVIILTHTLGPRTVVELKEDLYYDLVPGDFNALITDLTNLGLIEIVEQKVALKEAGVSIAKSLLDDEA